MTKKTKLPRLGFLYMDYVLRFFDHSNFKGWPNTIETVTYHWGNDKERFIKEVRAKKIDILIGNIPATAYETFKDIAKALPDVRFVPSIETQFSNKSKENVTLFCEKYDLNIPKTEIFYDKEEGYKYLMESATYPQIIKRSYGPSNYGGYFVHKVDNFKEAKELLDKVKYNPIYTQDAIDLKYSGDIRVMLIGHKPICAFWRFSGEDQWITNTSQGGSMSYDNVPMSALELAVKASKAAKAEYWACDIAIDAKTDKPYILECATAFAAFPYIRDWICQYLMWDFSQGRFPIPHVPLFSWEELGKINSNLLRTMRHIGFSKYRPSCDGEWYINEKENKFDMQQTQPSSPSDVPASIAPDELPIHVKLEDIQTKDIKSEISQNKINLNSASLTDIMTLHGMEEDIALEIQELANNIIITEPKDLLQIGSIDEQMVKSWEDNFDDMRIDINKVDNSILQKVKGLTERLANIIIEYRTKMGSFTSLNQLHEIEGIGKSRFESIKNKFKLGE